MILLSNEYKDQTIPLKYLCKKHINKGEQFITYGSLKVCDFGCKYCAREYTASVNSKGGITPLHNFLRTHIGDWIKASMLNCEYKCVLTGRRYHTVHHLYWFNKILTETVENLNYPIYQEIGLYNDEQVENLKKVCLFLHFKYGYGVCLCDKLHSLFHQTYRCGNNTPEQFDEFKQRLKNGEFNAFLKENNLKLVI